ncbi:MAG: hypothetical protein ACKOWF_07635, partial [Chloroflexota bacterium]
PGNGGRNDGPAPEGQHGNGNGDGNGNDNGTGNGNGNDNGNGNGNGNGGKDHGKNGNGKHRGNGGSKKNGGKKNGDKKNGNGNNDGKGDKQGDGGDGKPTSGQKTGEDNGGNQDAKSGGGKGGGDSVTSGSPTGKSSREDLPGVVLGAAPVVRIDTGQRIGLVQVNRERRDESGDRHTDALVIHILELADDRLLAGVAVASRRPSRLSWEHRETFVNRGDVGTWASFPYDVEFTQGEGYQLRLEPLAEDARPGSDTRGDKVSEGEPVYLTVFG